LIGQPLQGFNFSFDVTVVSEIADIIINIHIIINIADRVYGQQQFAESVEAEQVFLVESEAETNAGFAGLGSGEMKSRAIRSDEARARKNAKDNQRQRARKARISSSRIMTETDSAQEAKETEGAGK